jgi:hypothetical protein
LVRNPRATALRARIPAATITDGFDVFVQLVIAAITTCPWASSVSVPSAMVTGTERLAPVLSADVTGVAPSGSFA